MNGYIGFYNGRKFEVYAESSYAAQKKMADFLEQLKEEEQKIKLAEKNGEQVTHVADF